MGKVLKFWVIFKAFSSKTVTNKFTFSKKNSIIHDLLYLIAVALYETPINSSNRHSPQTHLLQDWCLFPFNFGVNSKF